MKRILLMGVLAVAVSGCISYSTFQTPRVLERGEVVIGAGATGLPGDDPAVLPEVYGRFGIAERVDAGVKMTGVPPWAWLMGDVKYQVVDGPFAVAADMGVSYAGTGVTIDDDSSDIGFLGLYPAIMAGTDRLYGGAKLIYIAAGDGDTEWLSGNLYGLFAGTSFGERWRFLPEVHVYFGDETAVLGGLGVQYTLGGE